MRKCLNVLLISLITGCASHHSEEDYRAEIDNLFNKARQINYRPEKLGEDHWQMPSETQKIKSGDCEDIAFYFEHLLNEKGLNNHRVALGYQINYKHQNLKDVVGHAWNVITINGVEYVADVTAGIFEKKSEQPFLRKDIGAMVRYIEDDSEFKNNLTIFRERQRCLSEK